MKLKIICLTLLIPITSVQADIYRWIDEYGTIQYSDVPVKGVDAEKLELPPLDTYSPPPMPKSTTEVKKQPKALEDDEKAEEDKKIEPVVYTKIKITAPTADQALRSNNGDVNISIQLSPSLAVDQGHKIKILLDGVQKAIIKSSSYMLKEVSRGTHSVQAVIVDKAGKRLKASKAITFHVLKVTVLFDPFGKENPAAAGIAKAKQAPQAKKFVSKQESPNNTLK